MASRRSRIKGLASIPQRRKVNIPANSEKSLDETSTNDEKIKHEPTIKCVAEDVFEPDIPTDKSDFDKTVKEKEIDLLTTSLQGGTFVKNADVNLTKKSLDEIDAVKENNSSASSVPTNNFQVAHNNSNNQTLADLVVHNNSNNQTVVDLVVQSKNESNNVSYKIKPLNQNTNDSSDILNKPGVGDKQPLRRKFLKPSVNIPNKRQKLNDNSGSTGGVQEKLPSGKETPQKDKIVILNSHILHPGTFKSEVKLEEKPCIDEVNISQPVLVNRSIDNSTSNEVTLNETFIGSQSVTSSYFKSDITPIVTEKATKRLTPLNIQNSDTEHPVPPASPTKINRTRIKAIPRLSQRKTSFSASESEDESRRNSNRHRNDSVCSVISSIGDTVSVAECISPQKPKEFNSVIQKKCRRTEQSRRLAEARREFILKFGASKPDRQKLTMMDLIFYNPTTNPMTHEPKLKKEEDAKVVTDPDDGEKEAKPNPREEIEKDEGKSDEENEMPVPQIKIGADGEIIIDEQSLVIENKETKKGREEIQKSKLIDGDFDTGYGIYKRAKRSKDWSHGETLRFYKALNTIGTDFGLMCDLFPRRTRRELKMKFKKEERVNKALIDRAVTQPCSFDIADLKHDVEMEERELALIEKQKLEKEEYNKKKAEERLQAKCGKKPLELSVTRQIKQERLPKIPKSLKPKKEKPPKKQLPLDINSVLEDSDADESDVDSNLGSDDKYILPQKPTRSGRIPKTRRRYGEPMCINKLMENNHIEEKPSNIEPGSIMIVASNGPNGEPVYKIFMVTPDQNATPLNLSSDLVSKAIEYKQNGFGAQNILTISTTENNETIPDDNRTIPAEEENRTIPAEEENRTIPAEEENRTIPAEEENRTIPAEEENRTIPAEEKNRTVPAEEDNRTIPAAEENRTTPAEEENRTIPAKEENRTIPAEEENRTVPAEQENRTMPAEEENNTIPAEEENRTIPAKEENRTIPAEEENRTIPTEEETRAIPAEEENKTIPAEEQNKRIWIKDEHKIISAEGNNKSEVENNRALPAEEKNETMPVDGNIEDEESKPIPAEESHEKKFAEEFNVKISVKGKGKLLTVKENKRNEENRRTIEAEGNEQIPVDVNVTVLHKKAPVDYIILGTPEGFTPSKKSGVKNIKSSGDYTKVANKNYVREQ